MNDTDIGRAGEVGAKLKGEDYKCPGCKRLSLILLAFAKRSAWCNGFGQLLDVLKTEGFVEDDPPGANPYATEWYKLTKKFEG